MPKGQREGAGGERGQDRTQGPRGPGSPPRWEPLGESPPFSGLPAPRGLRDQPPGSLQMVAAGAG